MMLKGCLKKRVVCPSPLNRHQDRNRYTRNLLKETSVKKKKGNICERKWGGSQGRLEELLDSRAGLSPGEGDGGRRRVGWTCDTAVQF